MTFIILLSSPFLLPTAFRESESTVILAQAKDSRKEI